MQKVQKILMSCFRPLFSGESRCNYYVGVFHHMEGPKKPVPPLSPQPPSLCRFYNLPTYRLFGFPKIFQKIPQPPVFIRWRSQFFTRWGAAPPRRAPRRGRLRATVCPREFFFLKFSRARFSIFTKPNPPIFVQFVHTLARYQTSNFREKNG
jgi:hypothetical protein